MNGQNLFEAPVGVTTGVQVCLACIGEMFRTERPCPKGSVPFNGCSPTAGQQPKPIIEPVDEIGRGRLVVRTAASSIASAGPAP